MPAAADLRDYLMAFVGKGKGATLTDTDSDALMGAANKALMDLLGDQTRTQEIRSALVRAPVNVTLGQVTRDSTAITFSGYEDWMKGCSIQIGSTWNRLVKPGASVALEHAYDSVTASNVAATVYQDAVTLDYAIDSPLGPILLDNLYTVVMVGNRAQLELTRLNRAVIGQMPMGTPGWAVMEDSLGQNATPATRFLFDSLPLERHTLTFKAALRPVQISSWSDTTPLFLPGGRDALILQPVARFYLSSFPVFIGDRREAQEDYELAKAQWAAFTNKGAQAAVLERYGC